MQQESNGRLGQPTDHFYIVQHVEKDNKKKEQKETEDEHMDVVTVQNQQMEAYSVKSINHEHDVM